MDGFEQLLLDFKNLSQNKSQQGTFFEFTQNLKRSPNIRDVPNKLGHSDISTTLQIYLMTIKVSKNLILYGIDRTQSRLLFRCPNSFPLSPFH